MVTGFQERNVSDFETGPIYGAMNTGQPMGSGRQIMMERPMMMSSDVQPFMMQSGLLPEQYVTSVSIMCAF